MDPRQIKHVQTLYLEVLIYEEFGLLANSSVRWLYYSGSCDLQKHLKMLYLRRCELSFHVPYISSHRSHVCLGYKSTVG